MYYPFLRGKQNELYTLSELASELTSKNVFPIVEPCSFSSVGQFKVYADNNMNFILIINPRKSKKTPISPKDIHENIVKKYFEGSKTLNIGILIQSSTKLGEIKSILEKYKNSYNVSLIHMVEYPTKKELIDLLKGYTNVNRHIFDESDTTTSYQNSFRGKAEMVLLRDSFEKKARNVDYPTSAYLFSDIHKTYKAGNFDGFGDYTITGNDTRENGGPAYAVAIHLTHLNRGDVKIIHFISNRTTGTTDPAGKFREANEKLNVFVDGTLHVFGVAVPEFQDLHLRQHYPGLGISKRLSMIRHIEVYMKAIN